MKDKYSKVIFDKLAKMQINDSFSKKNFITAQRGYFDYFKERSFAVLFCNIKKLFPKKQFKTIKGHIVRIK